MLSELELDSLIRVGETVKVVHLDSASKSDTKDVYYAWTIGAIGVVVDIIHPQDCSAEEVGYVVELNVRRPITGLGRFSLRNNTTLTFYGTEVVRTITQELLNELDSPDTRR